MSPPLIFQEKKNNIFFHIATIGQHYQSIVDELVNLISKKRNLFDNIFVGILGDLPVKLPPDYKILYRSSDLEQWEFTTLKEIKSYCKNHYCNVLYIHTKGVSAIPQLKVEADQWRQYMSFFALEKAEMCIDNLNNYDIVGVEWATEPSPHFSGNYWWATSSHINRLPTIEYMTDEKNKLWTHIKYNAEFWVGMYKEAKVLILYHTGIHNFQRHLYKYPRKKYARKFKSI